MQVPSREDGFLGRSSAAGRAGPSGYDEEDGEDELRAAADGDGDELRAAAEGDGDEDNGAVKKKRTSRVVATKSFKKVNAPVVAKHRAPLHHFDPDDNLHTAAHEADTDDDVFHELNPGLKDSLR